MAEFHDFVDDQFDKKHNFPSREPIKTLVIASAPRSGSWMLSTALEATGLFGSPQEYMHRYYIERWQRHYGEPTRIRTLERIMRDRTSRNGTFGIKLHYPQLLRLGGIATARTVLPNPRFVILRRRDVVKQAVSMEIARQTGSWVADSHDESALTYTYARIESAMRDLARQNATWRYVLAQTGARFIELDFEDIAADVSQAVHSVASLMETELRDEDIPPKPVTRRQSSAVNDEWAQRFVSDSRASDRVRDYPLNESMLVQAKAAARRWLRR